MWMQLNISGRLETGWPPGPGILCCSGCTWANVSSSNKIQRNYMGLKKSCVYVRLEAIMDKIQK